MARDFAGTDRFEIRKRLGEGGMGVVYEAFDRHKNAVVALKMLRSDDPNALRRFKDEFRSLADIAHENLVTLHELFADDGRWFFTLELVRGKNFYAAIRGDRSVNDDASVDAADVTRKQARGYDVDVLRDRLRQLARGLHTLHEAGKLHRDVKHSNVLVTDAGRVVVLDFGLVMNASGNTTIEIIGTPAFMAPEQMMAADLSPATDWYAVGVMLFEVLTGRALFRGSYDVIAQQKLHGVVPRPSSLVRDCPDDLEELCRALLDRDPAARPSGTEILARLSAGDTSRDRDTRPVASQAPLSLVGRERELAALHDVAARERGQPFSEARVVVVAGPSGVGKSTLVAHFLEELEHATTGALVLHGRCYENEVVPYKALDAVIDRLAGALRRMAPDDRAHVMGDDGALIARSFPAFGVVDGSEAGTATEVLEGRARRQTFGAVRAVLTRLAERAPLVVAVDDLQWSDADSAALLEEIVRPPDAARILFVAVTRAGVDEDNAVVRALVEAARAGSGPKVVRVDVAELTATSAHELAGALLRRRGIVDDDAADRVAREGQGNPFFIGELARFSDGAALTDLASALAARIAALPPNARALLEVVSFASGAVAHAVATRAASLLQRASGWNVPRTAPDVDRVPPSNHDATVDVDAAIVHLRSARFVRVRHVDGNELLEPYHDKIREAVASLLDERARANVHRALAEALVAAGNAAPEALARHLRAAGDRKGAARFALAAADRAARSFAFAQAALLYESALSLADDSDVLDDAQRIVVAEKRAGAYADAGRAEDAAHAYLALATSFRAASPPSLERALDCERRAGELFLRSGRAEEGLAALTHPLAEARIRLPNARLVPLVAARARVRVRGTRFVERSASELANENVRRELFAVDLLDALFTGNLAGGDWLLAAILHGEQLVRALDAGEPRRAANALCHESMSLAVLHAPAERIAAVDAQAAALVRRLGDPLLEARLAFTRGMNHANHLRVGPARALLDDAERILVERCRAPWYDLALVRYWSVQVLVLGDAWDDIDRRLPAYLADARAHGDAFAVVDCTLQSSRTLIARGDLEGAKALLDDARPRWSKRPGYQAMHFIAMYYDAVIALAEGRPRDAYRRVDGDFPAMRRSQLLRANAYFHNAHWLRALSALACARAGVTDADYARLALKDAVRIRKQHAWGDGRAAYIEAAVAHLRGDVDTALVGLERASAALDGTEQPIAAAFTRRLLGRLLGGDRGALLCKDAERTLKERAVYDLDVIGRVYGAGFPS